MCTKSTIGEMCKQLANRGAFTSMSQISAILRVEGGDRPFTHPDNRDHHHDSRFPLRAQCAAGVRRRLRPACRDARPRRRRVVIYTADGLENLYKDVLPTFEKNEGVKVAIVTAGSGEVVNRATVEKDSPKADVLVTLPPFIQQAQQNGLLQPYQSVNYKNVSAIAKEKDGAWATFVNNDFSFAINPEVTKTAPKTFADLLHPDYLGKIAYSNPATAGDGMAVIILTSALMGEDKAFDYLKSLEQSAKFHTKGTGYLDVLLSRNEIALANGDLQMDLDDAANGGLSIKPLFLSHKAGEAPTTFQLPYAIGLIKNGPNQAAGKKLIDYLMSSQVQSKVPDIYGIPPPAPMCRSPARTARPSSRRSPA
ncbi:MAG: 2-aminoethylphosphonate ABC transporter periplasmic binding component (TC 3.A.1.9.1) [uncultured Caballeronia sp.]|nr:MAG: 2-aminoethylphosphonate ABC transporter periplasmic binding component (TC 3.A.1.9.1) [uncultured Caballeronia sp.]